MGNEWPWRGRAGGTGDFVQHKYIGMGIPLLEALARYGETSSDTTSTDGGACRGLFARSDCVTSEMVAKNSVADWVRAGASARGFLLWLGRELPLGRVLELQSEEQVLFAQRQLTGKGGAFGAVRRVLLMEL